MPTSARGPRLDSKASIFKPPQPKSTEPGVRHFATETKGHDRSPPDVSPNSKTRVPAGWQGEADAPNSPPMQPETGGRFSFQLAEHDTLAARFQLVLATPEARWSGGARVSVADGGVEFDAWDGPGEPPAWLVQYTRAGLRSAWRQHGERGWARRVTRWRDAPERSGGAPEDNEG
jgi:hypothetical protein